ncbi:MULTISPECIES: DUF5819 family protein [unclassified Streptomyces]|uniref:DUF5819 family protein n=1 Tax=unclassified Streptomyces TaxID=2593676 RepID=UPI002E2B7F15|nr:MULTISPECIES: DUF5819 family protein [unclassified Streptomyces]WUB89133.1 DUF5819 family protein [Streptomyces sp. NBC_00566]
MAVPTRIESAEAEAEEFQPSDSGPATPERPGGARTPEDLPTGVLALRAGLWATVILCVAATLVHVFLVFLHVAPANNVSKKFSPQINAWVFPFFEQNWRLFAPEPESVNRQILVRTARTGPGGSFQVSTWFDLTALDHAAVEHQPFPSHTAQNLLRRAWSSYVDSHGGDDKARTERALMMQKYLTGIAADRVAAHKSGSFDFVQIRVVTRPIPASGSAAGSSAPKPAENRLLPWWKVPTHGK